MDRLNLTPRLSLVPQEALTPANALSLHDQSLSLQPTSLAIVNDLSNELKQLFPAIDLGVSSVGHLKETSLQGLIVRELIRRLGLVEQLGTDESSMPIMPPNVLVVDKVAVSESDAYNCTFPLKSNAPLNNLRPSPVKIVPIKTEPRYISGSEYFPSEASPSGRSSSPEERRETFNKRLLNKQRSPRSKKRWILGTDPSLSRNGERLIKEKKAQKEKIKIGYVDQEGGQSEKDWKSPEIEGSLDTDITSTGSLSVDDILPKWLCRDVDILRRALLTGIEKNVDTVLASYLKSKDSIQVDEMFGNSQEDNNSLGNPGSRVRVRTRCQGNEVTVCRELDLRPIVREHFRTLLFPNNVASRVSVPWKNLGIWLYLQEKRFTRWDRAIPTDFTVRGPLYHYIKKEQHRKMLLVDLEDWTEGEKEDPLNSEIPLVVDPKNRVLVKVGDLCEIYPGQFINNATTTGSKKRSGNVGPTAITMAGMSYTTTPRSQLKGKGLMTSPARCDSESDYY